MFIATGWVGARVPLATASSIVVVGSLNMDLVLDLPRVPMPGETLCGRKLMLVPGGKGANQAVACARLGGRVAMIGRVGADEFGEKLRRRLTEDGVGLVQVTIDSAASTGVAVILLDDSAQNRIMIIPGANGTLTPVHVDEAGSLIDAAGLMLVQLEIPLPSVERAIERAVKAGTRVLLNPAPAQALPLSIWPHIDYCVPNETEASQLTGIEITDIPSASNAAYELLRFGVRHVLMTLGSKGVLVADAHGIRDYAPPKVQTVDTTAAGDTFIGALSAALSEKSDLDEAAKFAVRAAALSVTRIGAQSSIPYRRELS